MCAMTASTIAAASLAISAASTVASIGMGIVSAQQQAAQAQAQLDMQARQAEQQQANIVAQAEQQRQQVVMQQRQQQQQMNLQVAQSNASMVNQYNQQREQVLNERAGIMGRYEAQKIAFQRSKERSEQQILNNNQAANRVYMAEQAKVSEAEKRAAFEQQALLAKSIGAKGSVLAAGRSGQSVGLLVNDVERQLGFAMAQENAVAQGVRDTAGIAMEGASLQNQSANNVAASEVSYNPSMPYLPGMPSTPSFIDGKEFSIGVPA
jgi:hypothetical protein